MIKQKFALALAKGSNNVGLLAVFTSFVPIALQIQRCMQSATSMEFVFLLAFSASMTIGAMVSILARFIARTLNVEKSKSACA